MNNPFQKEGTVSLRQKLKSGTIWAFIGHTLSQLLSLVTIIVLARLLSPQDFGVVAIAMVAWGVIRLFGNTGIGSKLIQQQSDIERYASAAFWLNLLIALCLFLFTTTIAPFVASFYNNPLLKPILVVLGLGFFLNGFGSIHSVLLIKELDFKKKVLVDITISLIINIIAIIMASTGYGVWSLIIPQVFCSPIRVYALWKICPWRPSLQFRILHWKRIITFGKYVLGSDMLRYVNLNADYAIIGRFLGLFELGIYTFAYRLARFPVENIVWVMTSVAFPAFSKLQNDLNRLREVFLKMLNLLSLITFPLFIGLLSMANELVPVVFGEKWNAAIVPLQIIIGFALISSFVSPCGQIVLALGKPKIEFKFNLVQVPLLLLGVFIGVKYGIIGVAIAMSLVIGTMGFLFLKRTIHLINLTMKNILIILFPALASSLLMLVLVLALRHILINSGYNIYQVLLVCSPFGALVYSLALLTFFRRSFQLLWRILKDVLGNRIVNFRKVYVS